MVSLSIQFTIHSFAVFNPVIIPPILASLKNLGAKTTSLFERKKKDVEESALEKAAEVQRLAQEQAKQVADSLTKAKTDAEELASSTGKRNAAMFEQLLNENFSFT